MRVPVATVFRAFPELDRFTDDQCRRLVYRAQMRAMNEPSNGCMLATIAVATGLLLAGGGVAVAWELLRGTWLYESVRRSDALNLLGLPLLVIAVVVGAGVSGLMARDRSLRRALREQIARTTCPACRASLLGAQRSADAVRCDGCSAVHTFESLGIQSQDLGPPLLVLDATASCPSCGYVIGGLPIYRGRVTCPECGERTQVVEQGEPLRDEDRA